MAAHLTSRAIRAAERKEHPDENHYRIFHKDQDGKKATDMEFWAKGDSAAKAALDEWKRSHAGEYFYGGCGNYISQNDDGTETAYDDMEEMHEAWQSEHSEKSDELKAAAEDRNERAQRVVDDFKAFLGSYDPRHGEAEPDENDPTADDPCDEAESVYEDFKYFLDHYDRASSSSHMRSEHWSLDHHILLDLEFNAKELIEKKHGVPTECCVKAVAYSHRNEPGFDAEKWYSDHNGNCSSEEMKLAETFWNGELERLIAAIQRYRYYSDSGVVDKGDKEMVELDKALRSTIPTVPGTDGEFDYKLLSKMTDAAWDDIWEIWRRIGRNCWD